MTHVILSLLVLMLLTSCGKAAKPLDAETSRKGGPGAADTSPASGEKWKRGTVQLTLDYPFENCVKAVDKTAEELKLKVIRRKVDGLSGAYGCLTADQHLVDIELKKISEKSTAVKMSSQRSGRGDPEFTSQVLKEIRKNL